MASNFTENYGLCQWEATDQVLRTEFNEDNSKIDTILLNHADQLDFLAEKTSILQAEINQKGNTLIYTTSYLGDGTYGQSHPVKVTVPQKPNLMIVTAGAHIMFYADGSDSARVWYAGSGGGYVTVHWDGSQISWYGDGGDQQMNSYGEKFTVIAFCKTE